eukprot:scaffold3752_cov117-Isochrysis_galbana.AAC.9
MAGGGPSISHLSRIVVTPQARPSWEAKRRRAVRRGRRRRRGPRSGARHTRRRTWRRRGGGSEHPRRIYHTRRG